MKLQVTDKATGKIYPVFKYIACSDGTESVWCEEWYGHHRIGFDCEWATETKPLPTNTQERIKADATNFANEKYGEYASNVNDLEHPAWEDDRNIYIAGATAVHDRAQVLVNALEQIKSLCNANSQTIWNIANAKIEQWKGKEVEK